jgi:hypothetical protein
MRAGSRLLSSRANQRVDAVAKGGDPNGPLDAAHDRRSSQATKRIERHQVSHHYHRNARQVVTAELSQDLFTTSAWQSPIEQQQIWVPASQF